MAITKVTGALVDIGDLDLTNVGTLHLDAIVSDASPAVITVGNGINDTTTILGTTKIGTGFGQSPEVGGKLNIGFANSTSHDADNATTGSNSALIVGNYPGVEAANLQAGIQFNIHGGSQNRVATIAAVAEASDSRLTALSFHTDDTSTRTEKMRISGAGKVTITEGSSFGTSFELKNTSNTHGSVLLFNNDSSSPADGDYVGSILFNGDDSAGNSTSFAKLFGRALDVTDGTEDGEILMELTVAGSSAEVNRFNSSEAVFNDSSQDIDFRVESDANTHAIFVDAGNNSAGFLKSSFTIGTDGLFVGSNGAMSITALQGTTNSESVIYCNRRGNPGDLIKFYKDTTEIGRIRTDGSTTSYVQDVSDLREKKNFESWDEKVLPYFTKLNPQKFHTLDQENDSEKKKGYIAQELFESFPEAYPLTNMGDDGDYRERHQYSPGNMVVYLMKAIQEQQEQIEEFKNEIAKLKGE